MATVATGYATLNKIFHISVSGCVRSLNSQPVKSFSQKCFNTESWLNTDQSVLVPPEETVAACSCVSQEVRLPWQGESSGVWGSTWMGLPRLGMTWKSHCRWRLQLLTRLTMSGPRNQEVGSLFFGLLFSSFGLLVMEANKKLAA